VIATEIASSPLWTSYRELAEAHQLRACWSTPILSPEGKAIGTFGLYYPEAYEPQPRDLDVVKLLSHTAALVIERDRQAKERLRTEQALAAAKDDLALQVRELKRAERALRDNQERFRHALLAANMGSWRADLASGFTTSDANLCRILGQEASETTESIEDRFKQIHPEDERLYLRRGEKPSSSRVLTRQSSASGAQTEHSAGCANRGALSRHRTSNPIS
jgi:PAS domain-containing protein